MFSVLIVWLVNQACGCYGKQNVDNLDSDQLVWVIKTQHALIEMLYVYSSSPSPKCVFSIRQLGASPNYNE